LKLPGAVLLVALLQKKAKKKKRDKKIYFDVSKIGKRKINANAFAYYYSYFFTQLTEKQNMNIKTPRRLTTLWFN
jgi:hypothetical protein